MHNSVPDYFSEIPPDLSMPTHLLRGQYTKLPDVDIHLKPKLIEAPTLFLSPDQKYDAIKSEAGFINGKMVKLDAKLTKVKMLPTGWGHGQIKVLFTQPDDLKIKVSGECLSTLETGRSYVFFGQVSVSERWGIQLKVVETGVFIPGAEDALLKYLEKNFVGMGKNSAAKVVDHYKQYETLEALRERLRTNPFDSDFSRHGLAKRKIKRDQQGSVAQLIYDYIAPQVGGLDVGDRLLHKIANWYAIKEDIARDSNAGAKAWAVFSVNPYEPILHVDGYGFKMADAIAQRLNLSRTASVRLSALATYAVDAACNAYGHTYLTTLDFAKYIKEIDPQVLPQKAIEAAIEQNWPLECEDGRYYLSKLLKAEHFLTQDLKERIDDRLKGSIYSNSMTGMTIDEAITAAEKKIGFTLDQSQYDAVKGVLTSNSTVHTITAGPGAGKTTIMEFVVNIMAGAQKRFCAKDHAKNDVYRFESFKCGFCAPTGKASKVLSDRISKLGGSASTIHSMLGVKGNGFEFNHRNKLDYDLMVIDESSMVDLNLLQALISALDKRCHLIFLGDPQQLPSVGPGSCLKDLMQIAAFDHHHLNVIHRNDGGILDVVQSVGQGHIAIKDRPDVSFIPRLPDPTEEGMQLVLGQYDEAIRRHANNFAKVGLLVARRKGDIKTPGWNVTYLNHHLREKYNPEGGFAGSSQVRVVQELAQDGWARGVAGQAIFGTRFRVRDRIIIKKNLLLEQQDARDLKLGDEPDIEYVVNGDTGYVEDYRIDNNDNKVMALGLALDDGRKIYMKIGEVSALDF